MKTTVARLLPLALLLSACEAGSPLPGPTGPALSAAREGADASAYAHIDLRAERQSLLDADRHYSQASGATNLVEGIVAMLAPQTAVLVGGFPVLRTPDAVRTALESNPLNSASRQTWTPVRVDVSSDGQHGYTYGFAELERPGGAVIPLKYATYWRRQPDGTWKAAAYKRLVRQAGPFSPVPPRGFESPDYRHYRFFPGADAASALAGAQQADREFSARAATGVGAAFMEFAADDGATLGGGAEINYGRAKIGGDLVGAAPGSLAWWPTLGEAAESGDLAVTMGEYEVRDVGASGSYTVLGRGIYMTIWKRQPNGEWRYIVD